VRACTTAASSRGALDEREVAGLHAQQADAERLFGRAHAVFGDLLDLRLGHPRPVGARRRREHLLLGLRDGQLGELAALPGL
jgi:hypothetical protein